MINVVIPMAGIGTRFLNAGYVTPKPFIEVNGKSLIELVLENLELIEAQFILLVREEHIKTQARTLSKITKKFNVQILSIPKVTEGATCTILHAHRLINTEIPLLIANSDQFIDANIQDYIDNCIQRNLDGSILTFIDAENNPKWSFAKINTDGDVLEVQEKNPIKYKN